MLLLSNLKKLIIKKKKEALLHDKPKEVCPFCLLKWYDSLSHSLHSLYRMFKFMNGEGESTQWLSSTYGPILNMYI